MDQWKGRSALANKQNSAAFTRRELFPKLPSSDIDNDWPTEKGAPDAAPGARGFQARLQTYPLAPLTSDEQRARSRGRSLIADGLQQLEATSQPARPTAMPIPELAGPKGDTSQRSAEGQRHTRYENAAPAPGAARGSHCGSLEGSGWWPRRGASGSEDRPTAAAVLASLETPTSARSTQSQRTPLTSVSPVRANTPPAQVVPGHDCPLDSPAYPRRDITAANPSSQHINGKAFSLQPCRPLFGGHLPISPPNLSADARQFTSRSPSTKSSQPIPIPHRTQPNPAAPLTGRYHAPFEVESHFPFEECRVAHVSPRRLATEPLQASPAASPTLSDSALKVDTKSRAPLTGLTEDNASGLSLQYKTQPDSLPRAMNRPERPSSQPRTSSQKPSYLSPHRTVSSPATETMSAARKPTGSLHLSTLPRFHPAVYQSPNNSAVTSPKNGRLSSVRSPLSPSQGLSQRSVPQQQLYQYQRELIATVKRAAMSPTPLPHDTPKAPALHPCGSPGPATPLALDNADYLTAGLVGTGDSRELVDKMIRAERERRTGMSSGHSSPAISPAGGRN